MPVKNLAPALFATAVCLLLAASLAAQKSSSTKIRPADSGNAVGNVLGNKPESVLQIVKIKGVLKKIDLEMRTITVTDDDSEQDIELSFSQPKGREQIKVSKKVEKQVGKKKLELEELKQGSKVRLQYYGALGRVMELIVEEVQG